METRQQEVALLKRELAVWACTLFMTVLSPVIATAATFAVYVLVDEANILTAAQSFSVLLLFAALRFPINYAGRLVGRAAQALSAVSRLTRFLEREVRDNLTETTAVDRGGPSDREEGDAGSLTRVPPVDRKGLSGLSDGEEGRAGPQLSLSHAAFQVGDRHTGIVVSEFNVSLRRGEVMAVCGPVGSGKSSLCLGIIDELSRASPESTVQLGGRVAYVPQTPFILNATLRENILFGLPFDPERYDAVLDACQLRQDIEQLGPAGDLTEIGERGVTLSGGQKQRVSLARAAFAGPDTVLLDDPLSALDAGTAKEVFKRLIRGESALFREAAVVLVTHASQFLSRCDRILLLVDGKNSFCGSWNDLSAFQPDDAKTREAVEHMLASVQEGQRRNDDEEMDPGVENTRKNPVADALMTVEEREHGLSSFDTWLLWFRRAGGVPFLGIMLAAMVFDRMAYVALEFWLGKCLRKLRGTGGAEVD